jgi:hypothetical protein
LDHKIGAAAYTHLLTTAYSLLEVAPWTSSWKIWTKMLSCSRQPKHVGGSSKAALQGLFEQPSVSGSWLAGWLAVVMDK